MTAEGGTARGGRLWLVAAPAVYVAGSLVLFGHWLADPRQTVYGSNDGALFGWWLRWTPYALGHGLNPLFTHRLNAPGGVNAMWNTSAPLLGVVAAPVTLTAGPLAAVGLLAVLAPALSATVAFGVFCRWMRRPAAAVGGLLYGFSPYLIGHSYGHLNLALALTPPLLLLLGDELLVRQRWPAWRTGGVLGVLVAAQLLVGEELLALCAVAAAVGVPLLALLHRERVRARMRYVLAGLGVAAVVAGVLVAVPLYYQLAGPGHVHGPIQPAPAGRADLAAFVLPPRLMALTSGVLVRHNDSFAANGAENTVYLGLPLLVLLLVIALRHRRVPLVRWAAPLLVALAVLSLGSRLTVDGHRTPIPLPWKLIDVLPVLDNALPVRLSVLVALLAGLLLGWWLDQVELRPGVLAAVTAVALLPLVPAAPLISGRLVAPAFFTSGAATRLLPSRGTVLVLPYPTASDAEAMVWQADAGLSFSMAGGYLIQARPDGTPRFDTDPGPIVLDAEAIARGGPKTHPPYGIAAVRADGRRLGLVAVVVGPYAYDATIAAYTCQAFDAAVRTNGGVHYCLLPPGPTPPVAPHRTRSA